VHFSHYSEDAVEIAVRLANTLDVATGEDALRSTADLADLFRSVLADPLPADFELGDRQLRSARALRSRLRSVWEADDPAGAAAAINGILDLVGAEPRISVADDVPSLRFETDPDDPVKSLGAVAALGLSITLIEGGWERLGTCSSPACGDVYVDSSKNRSRLYCSDTCTTRESVAAYRARHKATDGD
jgi:predicted RNA-binding Zn ribbon-like protein